jgi:hypothetical protein
LDVSGLKVALDVSGGFEGFCRADGPGRCGASPIGFEVGCVANRGGVGADMMLCGYVQFLSSAGNGSAPIGNI